MSKYHKHLENIDLYYKKNVLSRSIYLNKMPQFLVAENTLYLCSKKSENPYSVKPQFAFFEQQSCIPIIN